MKTMTKEWVKDFELNDLIVVLEPNTHKKIPFVFTNGGTEFVAKKDLHTVKTNFNLSEKENEMSFVMLPDTFDLDNGYPVESSTINGNTRINDFLVQYLNRLRVISYIPDDILKNVKDKRLLALGYAEEETKKEILEYIKSKFIKAFGLYEKSCAASVKAEKGLTIHEQLKSCYFTSLPVLFDEAEITKAETVNGDIHLTLDDNTTVVLSGAEIIEEETNIVNSYVMRIELYKKESRYELHLLVCKRDESFVNNYYYVTYAFKDLIMKN